MCASFNYVSSNSILKKLMPELLLDKSADFKLVDTPAFPHRHAKVVVRGKKGPVLTVMRYALTPAWSKDEKVKFATYNARLTRVNKQTGKEEKIFEAPTWKNSFGKKHCIVPLNGFFESCREGEAAGHMVEFVPKNTEVLFAAGIYEEWINKKTGETVLSFAIITTDPSAEILKAGHDRMPVFLNEKNAQRWLEPFKTPLEAFNFLNASLFTPDIIYTKVRPLKGGANSQIDLPE